MSDSPGNVESLVNAPAVPKEPASEPNHRPAGFRLIHGAQLQPRAPAWLIRHILERDALAMLFGDPGCGKSFMALDWGLRIATGLAFEGREVAQGPVIYLAGEGHSGIARRVAAWLIRHGESLEDTPFYISSGPAALCDLTSATEVRQAVDEIAATEGSPALVVVDTLARNFGAADENATQDMNAAVQALDSLKGSHGTSVMIVHHTGHHEKGRPRGATALQGALDAQYRLDKDDQGTIRLHPTKMKDAEPPDPLAFKLRTVELDLIDAEGQQVTSAVLDAIEYTEPESKKPNAGQGRNQQRALEMLARMQSDKPDGEWVSVTQWKEAMKAEGMQRQRVREAVGSLTNTGQIEIQADYARPR